MDEGVVRSGKEASFSHLTLLDLSNFVSCACVTYSDKKNNNFKEDCFWESTCGQKTPDWAPLLPSCRPDSKPKTEGRKTSYFPTSDPRDDPVSQASFIGPILQVRKTEARSRSNLSKVKTLSKLGLKLSPF